MQIQQNGLSIKEMKEIIKKVAEEVVEELKLSNSIKLYPVLFVEYYNSEIFKHNFKLCKLNKKIELMIEPIKYSGINYGSEIYIFLGNFILKNIKARLSGNDKHQLTNILKTVYHEICHSYQFMESADYTDFEKICIRDIEEYIMFHNINHYHYFHNEYLNEIVADLFGIVRTEKFLRKYEDIYNKEEQFIQKNKEISLFRKYNFNFDLIWKEFYRLYTEELENESNLGITTKLKQLVTVFFEEHSNKFKEIEQIYSNVCIQEIDKDIFCSILTSEIFLEQLNIENLNKREIDIMINVIEYILEKEISKLEYNINTKEKNIINEEYLAYLINKNSEKINQLKYLLSELRKKNQELDIQHYSHKH